MKGESRLKLLSGLENTAKALEELFFIFTLSRGTSFHGAEYRLNKYREAKDNQFDFNKNKRKFDDLMYRLRKDGLIKSVEKNQGILSQLTQKGKGALEKLKNNREEALPKNKYVYNGNDNLKIIIFDIPEVARKKRIWLRYSLINLKFKMLQKSVWIGKTKLPENFLEDLRKLKLLTYVEIFSINKSGSLKPFNLK